MLYAAFAGVLLAAEAGDPISGGAGWAGAGLLGLVLSWLLLVHLPSKDKQIMELIKDYRAESVSQRTDFRASLNAVIEHCQSEIETLTTAFRKEFESLRGRER